MRKMGLGSSDRVGGSVASKLIDREPRMGLGGGSGWKDGGVGGKKKGSRRD